MASGNEQYDHLFKILLIGDSGVGKSSIMTRYCTGVFDEDVSATIGVDFKVKILQIGEARVKLTIWDTAGQERFRTLTSSYYRGAHGVILVYDVTRRETFDNIKTWMKEVDSYSTHADIVKIVVGNKVDKEAVREVTREDGLAFARTENMIFMECSAKTKVGIQKAFEELVAKILEVPSLQEATITTPRVTVSDGGADLSAQGGGCGC
eukprot:TRINITY_DN5187_c0_g2_i1.p1 TRINITY_DN5187_c0_g2~~TRINITY_DN5187_c0_g2_i1.p1  ORF type:complete len:208 (+),score=50.76 TRINITY_DN5187_c0_g2_i1:59-682(+)